MLHLCQDFYINKLAVKFNVDFSKKPPDSFLMKDYIKNAETVIKQKIFAYQQRVESINYATIIIRPNVIYAVSKLSEFLINSSRKHFDASDRVFSYLVHIKNLLIRFDARVFDQQSIFLASSDASYADDLEIRYNSQNYDFMLFNGLVD